MAVDSSVKYWLWLSTRRGLNPQVAVHLYECLGRSIQRLYLAEERELSCYGLSPTALASLLDKNLDLPHQIMGDCDKELMQVITYQDAVYPNKLRNLVNPPLVLYAKGRIPILDGALSFAVVGARDATPSGIAEATELSLSLNKAGVYLVTGMAEGIDSAGIEGALKGGNPLVSVVAGGINRPFPRENERFYHDVATIGVVFSEYPPNTPHMGKHFRPRNRILSGLSDGVLIVECSQTGGSMMTATIAEEQGRDLFAMPGNVRAPNSRGPHRLIQRHGAYLCTCASDILDFYQGKYPLLRHKALQQGVVEERVAEAVAHVPVKTPRQKPKETGAKKPKTGATATPEQGDFGREFVPVSQQKNRFTDDQIQLLHTMGEKPHSIDGLVELSQIPAKRVLSAVTMLEMDGALKEISSGLFQSQVNLEKG